MLNTYDSIVLVIDIQEKLTNMLEDDVCRQITEKSQKLVAAAKTLGLNVIVTEQYPKGLGQTIQGIRDALLENYVPYEKTAFNALLENNLLGNIKGHNKKQVVICGIESHICVLQTALGLLNEGYEVFVVKDICASRKKSEFKCAMELLRQEGAKICTLEMVLFAWLKGAKNPCFKEVQALIK
ncbi:TPA: isochorismatase family protein [Candidatus Galligastranaerophilus intestinavium]|uniref:Isochorismatase family protein n=1 Tax=Candidatus Galligastranaerophilus intestinavium TaxID=2840836 RepID=A0A9D1FJL3_9BACT|nr:isochorismatase family protein [Candidatus Galligastranaerophilus intestinavium]